MPTNQSMEESTGPAATPRKRGRPRTVLDDHEVPERRRKQLRVAQQAYRRRKETTISTLQARVQELESGIEDVSQSFLSFSNLLLEADLLGNRPRIASALQDIIKQCVSLAKQGCEDPDEDAPGQDAIASRRKPTATPEINPKHDIEPPQQDSVLSRVENASQIQPSTALAQWSDLPMPPTPPYQEQAVLPFGIVLKSSPTIPLSAPIAPSSTPSPTVFPDSLASIERWTLSHRLVRECCQAGYRLVLNSANDHPRIIEIFGAPLSTMDRNRLLSGFYMAMNDDVGDLVEPKTRVLDSVKLKPTTRSPDMVAHAYRAWQIMIDSGGDELMDASGVQRLLQDRGFYARDSSSANSSPRVKGSGHFNASAFVKLLSLGGVCVGPGPAFRRRDVENALDYATSMNSSFGDASCLLG